MPLMQGRKRRAEPDNEHDDDNDDEVSEASLDHHQTQRRRIQQHVMDNEESFEGHANGGENSQATASVEGMTKKLVRLALACEYQRRPIRRVDISEKVLGATHGRQFKNVWNAAQTHLRAVFGMEMIELPAREKITMAQKRAAQKATSQSKAATTTSWILTSTLPPELRDPRILAPPSAPTPADDARYTGIYTTLVAYIALSGGQLPDAKLERALKRLGMEDRTPLRGGELDKTEKLLKQLEKDGYVSKIRESAAGTGEDDVYWVLGSRAKVEIGHDGVRGLTRAVFGEPRDEQEDEELERKIARSLGLGDAGSRAPPPPREGREPRQQRQTPVERRKRKRGRGQEEEEEENTDADEDRSNDNDDGDDDDDE